MYNRIIEKIQSFIDKVSSDKHSAIIAIDGRCASGKTTLAAFFKEKLDVNVIHMDDFFLRAEQRSKERLAAPGGNVDYERFLKEVLIPLKSGERFSYRPFDCKSMSLTEAVEVEPKAITIVEGSYSCHPELYDYYDLHVFLDVDKSTQAKRIEEREGKEALKIFLEKWIPLEEKYFSYYNIKDKCELWFERKGNYET